MTTRKPHKPHWYRIYIAECPMCGRDNGYRERVYGTKPEELDQRYVYLSEKAGYCGCMDRQFYG